MILTVFESRFFSRVVPGESYTSSRRAFLFSLKNHLNRAFKSDTYRNYEYAVKGNTSYGPTFGGGHDLYLSNQCHLNTKSYSNLGFTYLAPEGYVHGSAEARSAFARSDTFRCDEYEVFYHVWTSGTSRGHTSTSALTEKHTNAHGVHTWCPSTIIAGH